MQAKLQPWKYPYIQFVPTHGYYQPSFAQTNDSKRTANGLKFLMTTLNMAGISLFRLTSHNCIPTGIENYHSILPGKKMDVERGRVDDFVSKTLKTKGKTTKLPR